MSQRLGATTPNPAGNVPEDGGSFSSGSLHSPRMCYVMFLIIGTQFSRHHHPKNCHRPNYWTIFMGPVSSSQWAKLLRAIGGIKSFRCHVALVLSRRNGEILRPAPTQKEAIAITDAIATITAVKGLVEVARAPVVELDQVRGDGEAREGVERVPVGLGAQVAAVVKEHKVTMLVVALRSRIRTAGFGAN